MSPTSIAYDDGVGSLLDSASSAERENASANANVTMNVTDGRCATICSTCL